MIVLEKVPVRIAARTAKMDKVDAVAKLAHHRRQIIVGTNAERARAKAKPVGRIRNRRNELAKILRRAHDARQPENRIGRIVGMDDQRRTDFIRNRTHLSEEVDQMRT